MDFYIGVQNLCRWPKEDQHKITPGGAQGNLDALGIMVVENRNLHTSYWQGLLFSSVNFTFTFYPLCFKSGECCDT